VYIKNRFFLPFQVFSSGEGSRRFGGIAHIQSAYGQEKQFRQTAGREKDNGKAEKVFLMYTLR
jgi:hypothetical protein